MRAALIFVLLLSQAAAIDFSKCNLKLLTQARPDLQVKCSGGNQPVVMPDSTPFDFPVIKKHNEIKCGNTVVARALDMFVPAEGIAFLGSYDGQYLSSSNYKLWDFMTSCYEITKYTIENMEQTYQDNYTNFRNAQGKNFVFNLFTNADDNPMHTSNDFAVFNLIDRKTQQQITAVHYLDKKSSSPFVNVYVRLDVLQIANRHFHSFFEGKTGLYARQQFDKNVVTLKFYYGSMNDSLDVFIGPSTIEGQNAVFIKVQSPGMMSDELSDKDEEPEYSTFGWDYRACDFIVHYLAINPDIAKLFSPNLNPNCESKLHDEKDKAHDSIIFHFANIRRFVL